MQILERLTQTMLIESLVADFLAVVIVKTTI